MLIGRTNSPVCFKKDKNQKKAIDEALEMVGCLELKNKTLGVLSGGEIQRVMLASALYPLPELLILDEPVSGVDMAGLDLFYKRIMELRDEQHMAVLLVSHDLGLIRKYADKVVLLDKTVVAEGEADEVFRTDAFKEAFGFQIGEV